MARGNGGNAANSGNAGSSGSSNNSTLEDNSSPYYLHPSDNPSLQLVPQVLTGSNYINWSRSVTTALLAKNKLPFVNGTLLRPDDDHLLLPAWIRCNSMIVSWLRNSISPQICSSIMYLENAYEIWLDLRDRFSQSDSARSYQLRQQIMNLTQGQNDVSSYFTNLRIVWDEFKHFQPIAWCTCSNCRCNSARRWQISQEEDCTMQFLIGLNPSFSQIRSTILSMVPLPSLSKVFSMVVQEERQRNIDQAYISPSHSSSEQLFAANAASSSYGRGRLCTHCGKTNHTIDRCFVLHGFPPSFGRGRGKPTFRDSMQPKSVNLVEDNFADYSDKQFTNNATNSSVTAGSIHSTMEQCQHLMALLQSQLGMSSSPQSTSAPPENISAALIHSSTSSPQVPTSQSPHFAGNFTGDFDWEG
ncbi:uncharacterized protein LOC121763921 [Salvia splendens]|uniref:uncharacterized protein LOC121763921 n=1 Tax=Salvia splendens TaxID=180675 RepID=UPI001C25E4E8|nr:uncharacterized protein LOC121763921 [Salvia splendens]